MDTVCRDRTVVVGSGFWSVSLVDTISGIWRPRDGRSVYRLDGKGQVKLESGSVHKSNFTIVFTVKVRHRDSRSHSEWGRRSILLVPSKQRYLNETRTNSLLVSRDDRVQPVHHTRFLAFSSKILKTSTKNEVVIATVKTDYILNFFWIFPPNSVRIYRLS